MKRFLAILLCVVLVASAFTGCKKKEDKNKYKADGTLKEVVEVAVWNSGAGITWLQKMIEVFNKKQDNYYIEYKESADSNALTAALGMPDVDTVDLYMTTGKAQAEGWMEPLEEVILNATAEGDACTLGEKFLDGYMYLEDGGEGHVYTLPFSGGPISLYYNTELFEKAGITQLPRTTDELTVVCDTLYSKKITPLCHFTGGGYYIYYMDLVQVQYDGLDYYLNNFYACTDENGNSPSKSVFTTKDGRYQAFKAAEKFITPQYTLAGSNTKSHTEVQAEFVYDKAAMMINGSWLENEVKSTGEMDTFKVMKMPVISSITDKLTTVKSDSDLRKLITAIDEVTGGIKTEADFASGEDYKVNGKVVSKADWDYVKTARNTLIANYSAHDVFVPTYSDAKEGAFEFIKFMYSDAGYQIYVDELKAPLPMNMSNGQQVDTSNMSPLQQSQFKLLQTSTQIVNLGPAKKHAIWAAGATMPILYISFANSFSTYDAKYRQTADQLWESMVKGIDEKWDIWVSQMKK